MCTSTRKKEYWKIGIENGIKMFVSTFSLQILSHYWLDEFVITTKGVTVLPLTLSISATMD